MRLKQIEKVNIEIIKMKSLPQFRQLTMHL